MQPSDFGAASQRRLSHSKLAPRAARMPGSRSQQESARSLVPISRSLTPLAQPKSHLHRADYLPHSLAANLTDAAFVIPGRSRPPPRTSGESRQDLGTSKNPRARRRRRRRRPPARPHPLPLSRQHGATMHGLSPSSRTARKVAPPRPATLLPCGRHEFALSRRDATRPCPPQVPAPARVP